MVRTGRSYINREFEKHTDDECLLFKSIPMVLADKILKVPESINHNLDGIKGGYYNEIASRPVNLLTMATSIARLHNLPLETVTNKLIKEQRVRAEEHVRFMSKNGILYKYEYDDPSIYEAFKNIKEKHDNSEIDAVIEDVGTQTAWYQHQQYFPGEQKVTRRMGLVYDDLPTREGLNVGTMTDLTKPPSNRHISPSFKKVDEEFYSIPEK